MARISTVRAEPRRVARLSTLTTSATGKWPTDVAWTLTSNVAASKNLPLGSVAKVTNLENGKTATVKIEDRGPYVDGRVVDLTPKVARQLDIKSEGVAPVEVKPVTLPQPDGEVKLGAGAAEANPQEVASAVEVTKALTEQKPRRQAAR